MRTRLYIAGGWENATGSQPSIAVIDPATEEQIAEVEAGGAADVARAVEAAKSAFSGDWRQTTGAERAKYLHRIADACEARLETLTSLEVRDNGKPWAEAKWDIEDAIGCYRLYARLAEELDARRERPVALPTEDFHATVRLEPIGVVGQIIPWNYPFLMAAWKVAPAIAAGCTMVLKPSELTPLTALELGDIASMADLPPGVLNIVPGYGAEAGRAIVEHPDIRKLAFTGSVPTGAGIMRAAAQDIKNISLELGGKSPIIVFDDADIDAAVEWIMFGIFWNQGQVCSATSRLLIQEGIADRLLDRLVAAARSIRIGNGFDPETKLGPLVSKGQRDKVEAAIAAARADGVALLTGGKRPETHARGYFLEPTIFDMPPLDHPLWTEEIFGPVLAVRRFRGEDEAIALANRSRFGLAAAVLSANPERRNRVARALEAGIVWINCSQPTFSEAPWGGFKQSGIGRELGEWGLANYLETKQITEYVTDRPWGWYAG